MSDKLTRNGKVFVRSFSISHLHKDRYGDVAVFVAGALTPLGFAPFSLSPMAVLAPAVLFALWVDVTARRAAWRGFLYGCGFFGVGVSWVYVSLYNFGNMPAPLAAFAVLLFVAILALYPALLGALLARLRIAVGPRLLLIMPAGWVLFEWVRGWFLSGFPWLNLGYSQTDTLLAGFAPWLGVYGMSLAVAASAGAAAAVWCDRGRASVYLGAASAVWILAWLASLSTWVVPTAAPLKVALVQGNVPLSVKWRPEHRQNIIDAHVALSEQARDAQLVVWPESAVPGFFHVIGPSLLPRLERIAQARGPEFVIGAVELDAQKNEYYNTVFVIGKTPGNYRKRHLVPFGEFLPLAPVMGWLLKTLDIPMSNFTSGSAQQPPLSVAGQPIGVSVCYEDAFGEEVAQAVPRATLLVNVSEDAWFGDSLAPHQRLQMARVRAMESGRPMVRAANTGPSAIIDHRGIVQARSAQFERAVLHGTVQPMSGATPYARYGNIPTVALLLVIVVLVSVRHWRALLSKSP
jgi:apolipoprotein N-acyltransferase